MKRDENEFLIGWFDEKLNELKVMCGSHNYENAKAVAATYNMAYKEVGVEARMTVMADTEIAAKGVKVAYQN